MQQLKVIMILAVIIKVVEKAQIWGQGSLGSRSKLDFELITSLSRSQPPHL